MATREDLGAVSAYAIAVEHGYSGTEAQWLESLKGTKGDPGKDGTSPTVTVEKEGHITTITIQDAEGVKGAEILDGEQGLSPTVIIDDVSGGHQVVITDQTGPHTFIVLDGTDGADGEDYILTSQDKQDIANIVLATMANAETEAM